MPEDVRPYRTLRKVALAVCLVLPLVALSACRDKINSTYTSVLDHPLIDRRIEETPRQRTLRECTQEAERFRVDCTFCHTSGEEAKIKAPESLLLTEHGKRARIMRSSPTFGLHRQCSECHQSKFQLNNYAQSIFGPGGEKRKEIEQELQSQPVK